jgi:FMN reductase
MLQVTVVVGNPKPNSRTLRIAEALPGMLLSPGSYTQHTIDLADHSAHIFDWPSETMSQLTKTVAESNLLIIGSPTYKASYTGLLKGFLDRYPNKGLLGVTAIPVMTGSDASHSLSPDTSLRGLLIELGASLPTRSLYFIASQFDQMDSILDDWVAETAATFHLLQPLVQSIGERHPAKNTTSALSSEVA